METWSFEAINRRDNWWRWAGDNAWESRSRDTYVRTCGPSVRGRLHSGVSLLFVVCLLLLLLFALFHVGRDGTDRTAQCRKRDAGIDNSPSDEEGEMPRE